MRIVISQRAIVHLDPPEDDTPRTVTIPCTNPPILQQFDGFDTGLDCADSLSEALRQLGISGGRLRFRYDPDRNELRFYSEFIAPRLLTADELVRLGEETATAWGQHAGSSGFAVEGPSEAVRITSDHGPDRDLRIDQFIT